MVAFAESAFTHPGENEEVKEMHETKDQEHASDLGAKHFESFLPGPWRAAIFQRQTHIPDIDEIEPDHQ